MKKSTLYPITTQKPKADILSRAYKYTSYLLLILLQFGSSVSYASGENNDKMPDIGAITKSPTNSYSPGKAIWLDLVTTDVTTATKFYSNVFGWSFNYLADKTYATAIYNGHPIAAITLYDGDQAKAGDAQWLISFSSNNIDKMNEKVIKAGGKILEGPVTLKGRGKMLLISDSAGAELMLLHATGGDPKDTPATKNEWLWAELWTPQPKTASKFYHSVLGFESKTVKDSAGKPYMLLGKKGVARASVVSLTYKDVEPNWLPYLLVDDVSKTIISIEKNGGKLVLAQSKSAANATSAIVADPTGGVFAIQEKEGNK